ncbi:hypothetical protein DC3_43640 [Deinococcus cellulosilyticus NBRC 106333 = KACC 11606]|uniref:Uncharacterized protein n=1 Tax=Deinococcus cellulosilyticus (strain DSM 18568 / NBRC 106333 / KACC 11606 / 5516J-15) TaxID=1223518 RepID=A0A511N7A0_DEIC1|nr:hypothetical protein DC3_43640 [Deinococcus cellulosilyticus NBRC 106333 = KACC 11606]
MIGTIVERLGHTVIEAAEMYENIELETAAWNAVRDLLAGEDTINIIKKLPRVLGSDRVAEELLKLSSSLQASYNGLVNKSTLRHASA